MADSEIPASKEELMDRIRSEWDKLMKTAAGLSAEQMHRPDEGGWSPKDNLAHLAEWMKILMGYHMDRRPSHEVLGSAPELTADWDFDKINPFLFERNRHRTAEDVLGELRAVYETLWKRLEGMSYEDVMKPRRAEDPERRPLVLWILGDTAEHFEEHRTTIEKSL